MRIKIFLSLIFMRVISFRFFLLNIFIILAYSTILSSINLNADVQDKQINNFPEPIFEHLTIADGLPNNTVFCILQDHLGYLWIGNGKGLVKYDGYNMKVYNLDLENQGYQIKTIFEDKSGILWIGTYGGGLNCFDRTTEKFTKYMHNPKDSTSIINDFITSINQDKNGNILIGTFEGLNLFNKKDKKFSRIYYQTSVYPKSVYEYLSGLKDQKKTISSILHVGDNANITRTFTINKKTVVLTIMMGEEGCDYGWMENEKGEIITKSGNRNLVYANGYPGNQIQVIIDTLERGKYSLHYRSDYGWSYNSWKVKEFRLTGEKAPDYPDFWGIQVIKLDNGEKNIEEILNNKKSVFRDYIVRDIIKDRMTGRIYVGIGNKIFVYDTVKNFFSQGNNIIVPENRFGKINSFYQGKDGTIWIGHSEGLTKFNSLKNKFDFYQPIPTYYYNIKNSIGKIIEDDNGFIWSTTDRYGYVRDRRGLILRGLICFDPVKEQFQRYKHDSQYPRSLSSDWVGSLYKDRTGIVWAGTYEYGLNKWDNKKYKFKLFKYDPKNPKSKPFSTGYAISEDKEGIIWFGTDDGLYSFDRSSNIFHNYKYDINGSNPVKQIYIDSSGTIWIGTLTKGLGKFNRSTGTFQFYSNNLNDSTTISNNEVKSIIPGKNDILWIGTVFGLNKFDVKKGKFTRYLHDPTNPESLSNNQISFIYKDRKGILWLGSGDNGLNRFNPNDGKFTHFKINNNFINTVYEDKKENFWLGVAQDGIYLFDRDKEVPVFHITESNGLVYNTVHSILEDDLGNLWIGTSYGISKFDPKNKEIKNYFAFGSYGDNRFSFNACKTLSGEMLFGTRHGFIMFNPDSVKDDMIPPQVVINNVSLFNKPGEKLTDGYIPEMHELDLSYDQNDLRFDFAGIHFGEPAENKYKYMLENFDEDWVDAGTQRNATYTNLAPGEYVFKVLSCNMDGVWSKEGASIRIIISHPYWATWWAYSFYFLFGVVLLYFLRSYEIKRAELKNLVKLDEAVLKEREETDKMKSRFFANISHEFRTPLTLILGPAEKIISKVTDKNIIKDASVIKRNSNRLLQLVNQLLDLSKLEAGKLKLEASKNNIVSFVKGIALSFESLSEEKDITLKILSEKEYIEVYFDKEKMIEILSNILSNSFKFTPQDGNITITIKEYDRNVEIKIKDTGIGIPKEEIPKLFNRFYQVDSSFTKEYEGTGIGLALTKELVELHHGSISVESEMGKWTEFTLQFPVGREHLKDEEISTGDKEDKTKTFISEENLIIQGPEETIPDNIETNILEDDKTIVLIVEDNSDMREYIKESLEEDYLVEEAVNGEQGVRKAEKIIPDLIITDMMMPKMDGNELTRILKNNEKTSHIPIIILTAKTGQESKLEGLETGADDYLTKPFDIKELHVRIANLIKIRRRLQEKYGKGEYISEHKGEFSQAIQTGTEKLRNIDQKFMDKVLSIINKHISDEGFSIEQLGNEVGMSRAQVYRKIRALIGIPPNAYVRKIRLLKAKEMITNGDGTISEISYSIGFSSPVYFSKCFKEEFGYPPKDQTG